MIRLKAKIAFLLGGALCAAGFIVWPGCGTAPLPATRTPLSLHKRSEFSLKKGLHPSRDKIALHLGQPDEYYADLRVSFYKLNQVRRRWLWVFFCLPYRVERWPDGIEVAMIQFDDRDQAQRMAIKVLDTDYWLEQGKPWPEFHRPADKINMNEEVRRLVRKEAQEWVAKSAKAPDKP